MVGLVNIVLYSLRLKDRSSSLFLLQKQARALVQAK
jgi:hypothetical protein